MKNILLVGGGGHCASVADALIKTGNYKKIGIVDTKEESLFDEIPVVGTDDDLPELQKAGYNYSFISVGSIGNVILRRKLFSLVLNLKFEIPNIIDPSAEISQHATLGKGIFVGKNAVINAQSNIGDAAIINTGAVVEHDCEIGAFAHISPGATLCGNVKIGTDSHVGAGSVVIQGLHIGKRVIIGAGTVVIHDIEDDCTVVGNPGKVIRKKMKE